MKIESILKGVEEEYKKKELPEVKVGDRVRVAVKIKEGEKERLQNFEGMVIAMGGKGISRSMTVRHVSSGVGVERVFPLHAPNVAKIKVLSHHKTRRAKLYFLRERTTKTARLAEKRED